MAEEQISIPAAWIGLEDTPILLANQFMSQFAQHEFIVAFGQASPPILLGTQEQRTQQLKQINFIPIKTIARLGFTRTRLQELVTVLQQNLDNYDRAQREGKAP